MGYFQSPWSLPTFWERSTVTTLYSCFPGLWFINRVVQEQSKHPINSHLLHAAANFMSGKLLLNIPFRSNYIPVKFSPSLWKATCDQRKLFKTEEGLQQLYAILHWLRILLDSTVHRVFKGHCMYKLPRHSFFQKLMKGFIISLDYLEQTTHPWLSSKQITWKVSPSLLHTPLCPCSSQLVPSTPPASGLPCCSLHLKHALASQAQHCPPVNFTYQ